MKIPDKIRILMDELLELSFKAIVGFNREEIDRLSGESRKILSQICYASRIECSDICNLDIETIHELACDLEWFYELVKKFSFTQLNELHRVKLIWLRERTDRDTLIKNLSFEQLKILPFQALILKTKDGYCFDYIKLQEIIVRVTQLESYLNKKTDAKDWAKFKEKVTDKSLSYDSLWNFVEVNMLGKQKEDLHVFVALTNTQAGPLFLSRFTIEEMLTLNLANIHKFFKDIHDNTEVQALINVLSQYGSESSIQLKCTLENGSSLYDKIKAEKEYLMHESTPPKLSI